MVLRDLIEAASKLQLEGMLSETITEDLKTLDDDTRRQLMDGVLETIKPRRGRPPKVGRGHGQRGRYRAGQPMKSRPQANQLQIFCKNCGRKILTRSPFMLKPLSKIADELGSCQFCGHKLKFNSKQVQIDITPSNALQRHYAEKLHRMTDNGR